MSLLTPVIGVERSVALVGTVVRNVKEKQKNLGDQNVNQEQVAVVLTKLRVNTALDYLGSFGKLSNG